MSLAEVREGTRGVPELCSIGKGSNGVLGAHPAAPGRVRAGL